MAAGCAMTVEHWVKLGCHPATCLDAVRAIRALVRRSASADLRVTYLLDGELSRICLPSLGAPRFAKGLWRHTCFEAFVAVEGQRAYHEFNFAPSREWALYGFSGYRKGGPISDETVRPRIAVRCAGRRLEIDAMIRLDLLSPTHARSPLRIGLSAVIETSEGLSYWALHHPADEPDFHDPNGFVLVLDPPCSG